MSDISMKSLENLQSHVWVGDWNNKTAIFKVAQKSDRITQNEIEVGAKIGGHFNICKLIGTTKLDCYVDGAAKDMDSNSLVARNPIRGQTLKRIASVWERIDGISFYDFIEDEENDDNSCWNLIMQLLCCLLELWEKYGFVHGDLHFENVLVDATTLKSVGYSICGQTITLPLFGYRAVIIDLGNACCWKNNNQQRIVQPLIVRDSFACNFPSDNWKDLRELICTFYHFATTLRKSKYLFELFYLRQNLLSQFNYDVDSGAIKNENDWVGHQEALIIELNNGASKWIDQEPGEFWSGIVSMVRVDNIIADTPHNSTTLWQQEDGIIKKLIKSWLIVEQMLTIHQSQFVFDQVVNFVANEPIICEETYGLFATLIHDAIESCGIITSIDYQTCKQLFLQLTATATLMGESISQNMGQQLKDVEIACETTQKILSSVHNKWPLALIALFDAMSP